MKKTIKKYLLALESGNFEALIALFNEKAKIFSPLYGEMPAFEFYKSLFSDTQNSEIRLFDIFINKNKASCHFEYQWTLADGEKVAFECVDIFEFGENGKIDQLKIIYDTVNARKVFTKS